MTFKIITLGCKVNLYESEIMQEKLLNNGFILANDEHSDIIIINTCSVTNVADNKSKKLIRSARRDNKNAIIIACGCMTQNKQEEIKDLGIDILIGNKDKSKIVELLREYLNNKKPIIRFYNAKRLEFENMQVDKFNSHTRAFMKIQDGCNNYCTYCIIPYVRGSIRSKDFTSAIEEAKMLTKNGHKEIVLTGINTGAYGKEFGKDLVDLITEMSKISGLERIRISSIEITEINEKFLHMLKTNNKVCNHLHIPLQSGSERILKLMGRKYTKKEFLDKIDKIREVRKDINITTDVIVGFPSETEKDFKECLEFCKLLKFGKIHVFPYSKREGTKAAEMKEQLDNGLKKERARILIALSDKMEEEYNKKFINQKLSVLIETNKEGISTGLTSNYLKVLISDNLEVNRNYEVLIKEVEKDSVYGFIIIENKIYN